MTVSIFVGDCVESLRALPADSAHCVVTSPPFFGLRDYGVDGQIGLESTIDEHVTALVDVFREVKRVLRKDGTCWMEYGDAYATGNARKATETTPGGNHNKGFRAARYSESPTVGTPSGLKPKDLIGAPWRVAFALQADGWWIRSSIIWARPNPMPESVTDRPTKSYSNVFLLTQSARYFYDADAVREKGAGRTDRSKGSRGRIEDQGWKGDELSESNGRNLRDVWTIPTHAFPGAHFATFPPKIVEPCIKAGSSEKGCCAECGAPWERVVEKGRGLTAEDLGIDGSEAYQSDVSPISGGQGGQARKSRLSGSVQAAHKAANPDKFLGWRPTCEHEGEPVPCTVLDPFGGAGTTALVADRLGRDAILCELNAEYAEMARRRIYEDAPLFAAVEVLPGGGLAADEDTDAE